MPYADRAKRVENQRRYVLANREKILDYQRRYNLTKKRLEAKRRYELANRQKRAQYQLRYRLDNKEKVAECQLRYRLNNRQKLAGRYRGLRIRFKGNTVFLPFNPRKGVCSKCLRSIERGEIKRTCMHHEKYDAANPLANTIELCSSCHRKRHAELRKLGIKL